MNRDPYAPPPSSYDDSPLHPLVTVLRIIRDFMTVFGYGILATVVLMIAFAVIVEGESLQPPPTTANIGLGLLIIALIINVPIWLLWLISTKRR